MSDFLQTGAIATLHRLGQPNVEQLERELEAFADETPITNLHLSMLDRMGVPVDTFADSTGRLEGLSDL